ncbi:hypothetical protein LWI29_031961 [Acer saccharum]|uniref:Transposase MuDR plant domain-containing protein n=1 Tax=Acer saccharum TaxID=4024 RepID=A0AA39TK18_ACESA|nr:hypothetical protein LWI29_031961 [Acer saccharum]
MYKVISVPRETSYESLLDIVSRLVEANPSESSIKMKFIFNSLEVLSPIEVLNDDDVQVFLCENSDVNTRTSLCVTIEWKSGIIPNTQGPDNELVNEDFANVFKSDNGNGVGLDNIHESLLSPNDFHNANVFSIGVDNDDEVRDSRPSTSEVPSRRSRVVSSQGIGTKSSTIHGSYISLESVVNNVKEVGVGDLFPSKEELQMKMQLLSIGNHFQFKVKKSTKTLLVMSCIVEDCKWRIRATKLKDCESFRLDQLPCKHALAACNLRRSSCYDFCSHYYHKETLATAYGSSIYPVGPMEEWDVPDEVQTRVVLPPKGHKPRGCPAKKCKPSKGEEIVQRKCGRCGGMRHDRQKYKAKRRLSVVFNLCQSCRRRRLQGESRRRRRLQGECAVVVVIFNVSAPSPSSPSSSST